MDECDICQILWYLFCTIVIAKKSALCIYWAVILCYLQYTMSYPLETIVARAKRR